MKSIAAVATPFRLSCELCCHGDAVPGCRLCADCGDAIMRLVSIRNFSMIQQHERNEQPRTAEHKNVLPRAFSPFFD